MVTAADTIRQRVRDPRGEEAFQEVKLLASVGNSDLEG